MKTSIKTILAAAAMGAAVIAANAQGTPATPKVLTIDIVKSVNGYYRAAEETAKLQNAQATANKTAEGMLADYRATADKIKAAQDTINSPVATDIAKQQAQAEGQRMVQDLQKKQADFETFRQNALQEIQRAIMESRQQLVNEIIAKASEIGKAKGATMIMDRGALVYADPATEITDEVLAALNKGHPMPAAPTTPATPSLGYPGSAR